MASSMVDAPAKDVRACTFDSPVVPNFSCILCAAAGSVSVVTISSAPNAITLPLQAGYNPIRGTQINSSGTTLLANQIFLLFN